MYKILILTDSTANARSFPISEKVNLEETYPYLIRDRLRDSIFYQISFGNIETEKLCSQAISYLTHWKPDIIIVHSGLNDCRPEAFSEFQKMIILKLSRFFPSLKKYLYDFRIIRKRQLFRVSKISFKKTIKKFLAVFSEAKIFWLEIVAHSDYEKIRPGVRSRITEYNEIIEDELKDNFISIKKSINEVNGFNEDNIHWNKFGHKIVYERLLNKIRTNLNL